MGEFIETLMFLSSIFFTAIFVFIFLDQAFRLKVPSLLISKLNEYNKKAIICQELAPLLSWLNIDCIPHLPREIMKQSKRLPCSRLVARNVIGRYSNVN